jgi:hypothetical protein
VFGRDHAFDPMRDNRGNRRHLLACQVRRDFHRQRNVAAAHAGEPRLLGLQCRSNPSSAAAACSSRRFAAFGDEMLTVT